MSQQPLVSVLLPAYNHERWVGDAVLSLIAQTYPELELIAIDDGSTDGTYARLCDLLPALRRRFTRVELSTQPNQGTAATLTRALELARSEFVFTLDSDDVADPAAVAKLVPWLTAADDVAVAVGDNDFIDAEGHPCTWELNGVAFSSLVDRFTRFRSGFDLGRDFGTYRSLVPANYVGNGWLFRKSCVREVGGHALDIVPDDWDLLLRLARRYRIVYAGEPLVHYRIHGRNTVLVERSRIDRDAARTLLREHAYCLEQGLEAEWWSHAHHVFGRLALAPEADAAFLQRLFPSLPSTEVEVLRTLFSALLRTRTVAVAAERTAQSPSAPSPQHPPARPRTARGLHAYVRCWNDAPLLPFFFRHYDPLVERYVFFDDGSTDGSLEILRAHPKVEVRPLPRSVPDSFLLSELDLHDECWKESRGAADWVILTDIDEHFAHPDLAAYLRTCREQGVTIVPGLGYEMLTEEFPSRHEVLCETRTRGVPAADMCKLAIFAPDEIREVNYSLGLHTALPSGRVLAPARDELVLMHYRFLGIDHTLRRFAELDTGLRERDHANGWAYHYAWAREDLMRQWEQYRGELVDVSAAAEPWRRYPFRPWWSDLPRFGGAAAPVARVVTPADGLR